MNIDCKCLLCKDKLANKTGSHIVPCFIMKRINGHGQRDHEVGFVIKSGVVDTYFGREIYEEKRREITDSEEKMESRDNDDVRDYIFCDECETYFSRLESEYSSSLSLNFTAGQNTINNKVTAQTALLFWCSIVWRVSATNHLGQRLNPELEERLRVALESNSINGLNIKYALYRCKDYGKSYERATYLCMDTKDKSVLLVVDEFMLLMVFDMNEVGSEVRLLDVNFNLIRDAMNDGTRVEEISPMPFEYFECLIGNIQCIAVRQLNLVDGFRGLHRFISGRELPDKMLNEMLSAVQTHQCKLGDRYTSEHYALCYKEVMMKYGYLCEDKNGMLFLLKTN